MMHLALLTRNLEKQGSPKDMCAVCVKQAQEFLNAVKKTADAPRKVAKHDNEQITIALCLKNNRFEKE